LDRALDGRRDAAAPLVEPSCEAARAARSQAGREALPRLVTIPYLALGDPDGPQANIRHYYAWTGEETADIAAAAVCGSARRSRGWSTGLLRSAWTRSSSTRRVATSTSRLAEIVF
jgi:hypothetical protein